LATAFSRNTSPKATPISEKVAESPGSWARVHKDLREPGELIEEFSREHAVGAAPGRRETDHRPQLDPLSTIASSPLPASVNIRTDACVFATPMPGTYGDLERGSLKGPKSKQMDVVLSKHVPLVGKRDAEVRIEIFNIFNSNNFTNPAATLPNALPTAAVTETNKVQPGQAYTSAAAGTFGRLTSTVGRTVGLGTNRQVQFAFRLKF
jgi:hypothetical protein